MALWSRDGASLPASEVPEPAPPFDRRASQRFRLDDRATRLLAVQRTWSLLRRYCPPARLGDDGQRGREALVAALCRVAEDPAPQRLHSELLALLAALGDGNATIDTAAQASSRWLEVELDWIEERVVVCPRVGAELPEGLEAGDVVVAIDGEAIDARLPAALRTTPAATASARVRRAVAQLCRVDGRGATRRLTLRRETEAGDEQLIERELVARARRPGTAGPRPRRAITKLAEDIVYVDATRVRQLGAAARRLRRARAAIIDLRGELDARAGSLLAHFTAMPVAALQVRVPAGPDADGQLPLAAAGTREIAPTRPSLACPVVLLADARTRGRAELELAAFDASGRAQAIVGAASAGDLADTARAWLPGGWVLRFSASELRRHDGRQLWGRGVAPTHPVEGRIAALRAGEDAVLRRAVDLLTED